MVRRQACEEQKHQHSRKITQVLKVRMSLISSKKREKCGMNGEIEEKIRNTYFGRDGSCRNLRCD